MTTYDLLRFDNRTSIPLVYTTGRIGNVWGEVNRFFENFFHESIFNKDIFADMKKDTHAPTVNIRETDKEFIVTTGLFGMKPADVNVSVRGDNVILIRGKRGKKKHSRREAFERVIKLSNVADSDKATAGFESGVLTIKVPKKEISRGKPKWRILEVEPSG